MFYRNISFEIVSNDIEIAIIKIEKDNDLRKITKALFRLNDSHKIVFSAHKFVCERAVEKGEKSIRGGEINMLENKNFADSLAKLKKLLNEDKIKG